MKKYDVQCPHCCGTFHETTIHFRQGVPVKGHMLTIKQHVKDAAWSTFPEYDSTEYQDIICPSCSQAYLDSLGGVIRLGDKGETLPDPPSESETVKASMDMLMEEYDPEVPIRLSVSCDEGEGVFRLTRLADFADDNRKLRKASVVYSDSAEEQRQEEWYEQNSTKEETPQKSEPELPEVAAHGWDYSDTLSETHTFDMVRSKFAETMQQSESMISAINASTSAINTPTPKKKPGRPKK